MRAGGRGLRACAGLRGGYGRGQEEGRDGLARGEGGVVEVDDEGAVRRFARSVQGVRHAS